MIFTTNEVLVVNRPRWWLSSSDDRINVYSTTLVEGTHRERFS